MTTYDTNVDPASYYNVDDQVCGGEATMSPAWSTPDTTAPAAVAPAPALADSTGLSDVMSKLTTSDHQQIDAAYTTTTTPARKAEPRRAVSPLVAVGNNLNPTNARGKCLTNGMDVDRGGTVHAPKDWRPSGRKLPRHQGPGLSAERGNGISEEKFRQTATKEQFCRHYPKECYEHLVNLTKSPGASLPQIKAGPKSPFKRVIDASRGAKAAVDAGTAAGRNPYPGIPNAPLSVKPE